MSVPVYWAAIGDTRVSEHFFVRDFACRDGSAEVPVDDMLVHVLERLYRALCCSRIQVCAGYRSAAYARRINRTKDPYHMQGKAADVICYDYRGDVIPARRVLQTLDEIGHKGGAAYASPTMVHIDTGDKCVRYDEM